MHEDRDTLLTTHQKLCVLSVQIKLSNARSINTKKKREHRICFLWINGCAVGSYEQLWQ